MSNRVYVLHIEAQILGVFVTRKAAEAKRDALYSTEDCKITPTTLYGIELR